MLREGATPRRALLVLALLCAVVVSQTAFFSGHIHDASRQHCCWLCHIGPLPFVAAEASLSFFPDLSPAWAAWTANLAAPSDAAVSPCYSRGPPA